MRNPGIHTRRALRRDLAALRLLSVFDDTSEQSSNAIEYDGRGHFEGQDFYRDATGVVFEERLSGTYVVNPDGSGWSLGIARIRNDGSVKVRSRFKIHPSGSIEFHADAIRGALPSISSEGVLRPE